MRPAVLPAILIAALLTLTPAWAATGSLDYRARVVHNNRSQLSFVRGTIDLGQANFRELVEATYRLDWKRLPGGLEPAPAALPAVWEVDGRAAQRYGRALPSFDNPLLRHFLVKHVVADPRGIREGAEYLSGQLVILTAEFKRGELEIVASFRGAPLVIVGRGERRSGRWLPTDLAVLGPKAELYQYFFDQIEWSARAPQQPIELPAFHPADYVSFPSRGPEAVAIRPVKDWLVFQARLPSGRPLNLVFDSGAEMMLVDDMVLEIDALLQPVGELAVAGALEDSVMKLYEGFSFAVGGVEFRDLTVIGAPLTTVGFGADVRIHGIVGGELLKLCRIDLDLAAGQLTLSPPQTEENPVGEELALTLIEELPHVEAQLKDAGTALLLLDTGQRAPLSVNIDWLEQYELDEQLKMYGFLGDVTGGLAPRYILEELDFSLAGRTYTQKTVDAGVEPTYSYDGMPVVGSIGFPLLARHFGGITFDYSRKRLYLRDPGDDHIFSGRPEAWAAAAAERDGARLPLRRLTAAAGAGSRERSSLLPPLDPGNPLASYTWSAEAWNLEDPLTLIRGTPPGELGSRTAAAETSATGETAATGPGSAPAPTEGSTPAPPASQPPAPGVLDSLVKRDPAGSDSGLIARLKLLAEEVARALRVLAQGAAAGGN